MSADPVKKRGRPKKVISDPVEAILPEGTKKTTARSKSTVAASKTVTSKTSTVKPPTPVKSTLESWKTATSPQKSPTSPPPRKQPTPKIAQNPTPTKTTSKSSVTLQTSKILSQVRELSANNPIPPGNIKKSSKPSSVSASSNPQPSTSNASLPKKPAVAAPIQPLKTPPQQISQSNIPPNTTEPPLLKPAAKIPVASLNSQIVDNIATRAGARPNTAGSKSSLPPNYRPVARKVTMTIVALPILLVTSWVLYERCKFFRCDRGLTLMLHTVILGQDRKVLVKSGLPMVEGPGDSGKGSESSPAA